MADRSQGAPGGAFRPGPQGAAHHLRRLDGRVLRAHGRCPPTGEARTATLRLPEGEPLVAPVRVVGSAPATGCVRVSFAFGPIPGATAEKLEMAIFDLVLAQLNRAPGT